MRAVDLPSWRREPDDAARAAVAIDDWASSDALEAIVRAFGGSTTGMTTTESRLDYLDEFSRRWDYRGGLERDQSGLRPVTTRQQAVVEAAAAPLGLAERSVPRESRYDTVVMTGGMIRAGIVKPRFVRELIGSGLIAREIVFLGAFRAFSAQEQGIAAAIGVIGSDEVDAMTSGMERAFGPLPDPTIAGHVDAAIASSWRETSWQLEDLRLSVLAAPSSDPRHRRANTADTYRFWAAQRQLPRTRSALLVTTPIYVPYQGTVAVEVLGLGFDLAIETVGVSATASDLGAHSQPFLVQHHLQEIRSTIHAMRSLRRRLAASRQQAITHAQDL